MATKKPLKVHNTLKISKEQWFIEMLDIEKYLNGEDYSALIGQWFSFQNKPWLRNLSQTPVRCFLVENKGGKSIYRGHCDIVERTLDYQTRTTSGKYKITKLFRPEEIQKAFDIIDGNEETNYFVQQ